MPDKYIIKEMSDNWNLLKFYFPNFEMTNSKVYEIVFARVSGRQLMEITLLIPEQMLNKKCELYFTDGKGKIELVKTNRINNKILFTSDKVGLYILSGSSREIANSKLSQILLNVSNLSKGVSLKIKRAIMGM